MRRLLMLALACFLGVAAKAGGPQPVVPYHLAYRAGMFYAVPNTPHDVNQAALAIFDSANNAIRINASPVAPGSTPSPHDANQVFTSIFDDANNAIYVNCVDGCGGSAEELHVNGGSAVSAPNFGSTPSAATGSTNVIWQQSGSNISAEIPYSTDESALDATVQGYWSPQANLFTSLNKTSGINLEYDNETAGNAFAIAVAAFRNPPSNVSNALTGAEVDLYDGGTHNAGGLVGFASYLEHDSTGTSTGMTGFLAQSPAGGGGAISFARGMEIRSQTTAGASSSAGVLVDDQGSGTAIDVEGGPSTFKGNVKVASLSTQTNCASSVGTCGSAASGSVSIAAAATTVTVATTAVTANSVILITEDDSLGAKLGVTCNTTLARVYEVSARTAATSFVISTNVTPSVNPACLNYLIVN